MKVLHFIYDDLKNPWVAGGGAVRTFEIYRALGDRVDATVVTGSYPGARDEVVEGVRFQRIGATGPYAWSRLTYGVAASRLMRRAEYDVAVSDFSVYTPLVVPRDRPVGFVLHHVTGPSAGRRWGRLVGRAVAGLERWLLGRARIIGVPSRWAMEQVGPLAPEARLDLVGGGVGDAFFQVRREEGDYVLFFGRLDVFQKGLDTLIRAYAALREAGRIEPLYIAGRGKDARAVDALAREAGVSEYVRLLGAVDDRRRLELLAGARVLLMPSRFEGFGLVAAEAMAAGVPLVASDAGALPEVVDAPRGGILVPVDDADALAAAAESLLREDARRAALSASARDSARRFRWDAVAERHLAFLEDAARL
ncbi:MAG TPA: glycosyltransferase family 4 protein [Longimicrobiales bacterium]|nr:glycosyltransferase family 4 protein [Longimicrobiales bacterium]